MVIGLPAPSRPGPAPTWRPPAGRRRRRRFARPPPRRRRTSREYTGMNDADSTPSPSRFCIRLGMRSAARKASAEPVSPRKPAVTTSRAARTGATAGCRRRRGLRRWTTTPRPRCSAGGCRLGVAGRPAVSLACGGGAHEADDCPGAVPPVSSSAVAAPPSRDEPLDVGADRREAGGVADPDGELDRPGDRLVQPGVEDLQLAAGRRDSGIEAVGGLDLGRRASAVCSSSDPSPVAGS